ncbi:U-box domain-containing protein 28 [Bidens hawaiensis]|uniref:U-box domain-containing protein 28 n=1 Tax=Bidens hawaiensis TaxID=980011 RepID=UPI00404A8727
MARDNSNGLYLSVPSFFKCPISMDVMKSPVSLCTGVTYDRASIQKWLDSGHNTCPATMQVLQSTDVVPNLTLRRLIRVWSDSYLLRPESHASFNNHQAFESLKKLITTDPTESVSLNTSTLSSIISFAKSSAENRESLAKLDGFVPLISKTLRINNETESNACTKSTELVLIILDLISSEKSIKPQLVKLIANEPSLATSLTTVLLRGTNTSRISTARVLESLAAFDTESRRIISENSGILKQLVQLTNSDDMTCTEAGVSALASVATSRQAKKEIIRLGIITTAGRIISSQEYSVTVVENVLKLLEMVSTCTEGRTGVCENEQLVEEVVRRLLKVSPVATECAIGVIWSVCYMARDRAAQEAAMRCNGLTKVLLVMQSNCSGAVRQMCGELVKVLRVNSKSCLASYETQTTHITPY